ncbi:hypothetical protein [Gemelliphila palaticanis]|nr:hypothetical protein [Gemella palaticanis]
MKWYNYKNFRNLILGKSFLNIGDSFYFIAISIGLVTVYNIDVSSLSLFALLGMLPKVFAFLYGSYIDNIKNKKIALITTQTTHIFVVLAIIITLYLKLDIYYIYFLNIIFSLVNTVQASLQVSFVSETLEYKEDLINKSVDIQYFTTNTLDIISNFVVSLLLGFLSYLIVLELSIPFFVFSIFFFSKIFIKKQSINNEISEEQNYEDEEQSHTTKDLLKHFRDKKKASFIVSSEAFLSGMTDMLITLIPIYLVLINIDIKWLGLVVATQRAADFLGAMVAPYVKMKIDKFFMLDYILTGTMFVLIFILDNIYLKLILFFFSFLIIGISGNFFEKMIYKYYDYNKLAGIHTVVTTLYSFFGIIFLLIPMIYSNIVVLGITFNVITVLFGLILLFFKKEDNENI